jgi:hypothetical protein
VNRLYPWQATRFLGSTSSQWRKPKCPFHSCFQPWSSDHVDRISRFIDRFADARYRNQVLSRHSSCDEAGAIQQLAGTDRQFCNKPAGFKANSINSGRITKQILCFKFREPRFHQCSDTRIYELRMPEGG